MNDKWGATFDPAAEALPPSDRLNPDPRGCENMTLEQTLANFGRPEAGGSLLITFTHQGAQVSADQVTTANTADAICALANALALKASVGVERTRELLIALAMRLDDVGPRIELS